MLNPVRRAVGVVTMVAAGFGVFGATTSTAQESKTDTRVYELRTYTTLPGRMPALHKRFADHTMRFFERHGMKNVTYWVPVDPALKENTMIYLLSHASREAADASWKAFASDPEWIKARDASEADGKILAKAPDRVFMRVTDYSPSR